MLSILKFEGSVVPIFLELLKDDSKIFFFIVFLIIHDFLIDKTA